MKKNYLSILYEYAPDIHIFIHMLDVSPEKDKKEFYDLLKETIQELHRGNVKIMLGDYNANIGRKTVY